MEEVKDTAPEATEAETKPVTEATEQEAPKQEDTPATEATEEAKQPEKKPWYMDRIGKLTRDKGDLERQLESIRREHEALREMLDAKGEPSKEAPRQQPQNLTEAEIDRRAEQKLAERLFNESCNATYTAGKKEFGDFDEAVQSLNTAFPNQITRDVLEPITALPNGAAVYRHLGLNPDEAHRILGLSPARMGLELAKLSASLSEKPKPVSKAPAPVKPIDGHARAAEDLYDPKMPIAQWIKLREKQIREKNKR